jgi:hypothetical protein
MKEAHPQGGHRHGDTVHKNAGRDPARYYSRQRLPNQP